MVIILLLLAVFGVLLAVIPLVIICEQITIWWNKL